MMRIENIKADIYRFEIPIPYTKNEIDYRVIVICRIDTDDGQVGYGMADGLILGRSTKVALEHDILDTIKGMDPYDTEAIHDRIWWKLNPRSVTGVIFSAISALDIACWDLRGRAENRSIASLLGGHKDFANAYVTFGFPQYDFDQLVEAARAQAKLGTQRLKMVVPAELGWRENVRRVRAVREAIGDDVDLMIDANQKFTPNLARQLVREVEECRITWFEEPVYQNDAEALHELKTHTRIPLAAGQAEGHRWRMREFMERRALDIIQPNVCNDGGYTEARKVAHMAQAFNMPVANGGGWGIFNMHLIAAMMNGMWAEFPLGMVEVARRAFKNPPEPVNNVVKIPDAPGLGFEPDFEQLADYVLKD
ncbi:MAG: mandelate racemase/muconate lactonizing enzyme family protein [Rhizobiaceae bacterium]